MNSKGKKLAPPPGVPHSGRSGSPVVSRHGGPAHPICQEELYNPGRDVSINPNENSILTRLSPVPDVRLGYTSDWTEARRYMRRGKGRCEPRAAIRMALSVRVFPFREVTPS